MKKTLQIILVATVAGSALLAAMPTQAFWGPMNRLTHGGWGGPWGGPWGGYPYYGGYYPYYHTSNDTIANCGDPTFFYSAVKTSVSQPAAAKRSAAFAP